MPTPFTTVDEYAASLPDSVRAEFDKVRRTVTKAAPKATEEISYGIAALKQNGKVVVYFSGWKQHISLYPIPDGDADFLAAIEPYRAGKGTLKFPLKATDPVPPDHKIVKNTSEPVRNRPIRSKPDRSDRALEQLLDGGDQLAQVADLERGFGNGRRNRRSLSRTCSSRCAVRG